MKRLSELHQKLFGVPIGWHEILLRLRSPGGGQKAVRQCGQHFLWQMRRGESPIICGDGVRPATSCISAMQSERFAWPWRHLPQSCFDLFRFWIEALLLDLGQYKRPLELPYQIEQLFSG